MRVLVLLLLVSIPIAAGTVESASVTCEGVVYQGTDSASCSAADLSGPPLPPQDYYSVSAEANTGLAEATGMNGGASASFTADFVLTVTGGSGDGFFDPELGAQATSGFGASSARALVVDLLGNGCIATSSSWMCGPIPLLPFVFGVPDILTLTLNAYALDGWAWAGYGPFEFFDSNGQPLSGVSYTFVPVGPVPEPGTLLLTAAVCVVLRVFDRRRRKR